MPFHVTCCEDSLNAHEGKGRAACVSVSLGTRGESLVMIGPIGVEVLKEIQVFLVQL